MDSSFFPGGEGDNRGDAAVRGATRYVGQGVALGRESAEVDVGIDRSREDDFSVRSMVFFGGRGLLSRTDPGHLPILNAESISAAPLS